MKNFKQLKDRIVQFLDGNHMIESFALAKDPDDMFDDDAKMRYVAYAPSNFDISRDSYSLTLTFAITTKVPQGDEDAYITAQEENVLITAQLMDLLDTEDVDAEIRDAMFSLPTAKDNVTLVSATFDLIVNFQRVQYRFYDE